jgi:hypothetical protein
MADLIHDDMQVVSPVTFHHTMVAHMETSYCVGHDEVYLDKDNNIVGIESYCPEDNCTEHLLPGGTNGQA